MKLKLFVAFNLIISGIIFGQKHDFLSKPKLTLEEVSNMTPAIQKDAPAEILYQSYHYRIDINGNMYADVISRIKIYNKDRSSRFLDEEVALYESPNGSRERLVTLKANTYNVVDGKLQTTKVEKDSKFRSTEDKRYNITKFAFPDVKDGSVLEYEYTVETPFLREVPRVMIEESIPTKYIEYVFETPKLLGYTINYKGTVNPTYREVAEKSMYGSEYNTYRFGYENVPAYKEEEFVMNNDNYKTSIKAELNSTNINNIFTSYAVSWDDIRKKLYENEDFGDQLKKTSLVKDLLPADVKSVAGNTARAEAILKYVQKNYKWNESNDVVTDKGIKNLITTKIGNAAEINLLLVMLMRSANLTANPVVLSTVKRGMLLSYSPTLTQLNYVVAAVEDDENLHFFDATSKYTTLDMLPPRALNYTGLLMKPEKASQLDIVYPQKSGTVLTVNAKLNSDGTFTGTFKDRDTKLFSMLANESFEKNKDDYQNDYKNKYKFSFADLKSGPVENNDFETSFNFNSDTFVDAIGNKLVFNPLLFLYNQNHSFNQTEPRKAPLEFLSGYDRVKKVTITLPDGYAFENVPKSKRFKTDDDAISYTYLVTQEGNKLTVETITAIEDSHYPKEYYPAFKQIFDNITKLEGQVVTVVKK